VLLDVLVKEIKKFSLAFVECYRHWIQYPKLTRRCQGGKPVLDN